MKNRIASMIIGGLIGVLVTSLVFASHITNQANNYAKISGGRKIIVVPDSDSYLIVVDKNAQ